MSWVVLLDRIFIYLFVYIVQTLIYVISAMNLRQLGIGHSSSSAFEDSLSTESYVAPSAQQQVRSKVNYFIILSQMIRR